MAFERTPIKYRMGCSDPLPAGHVMRFGSLDFEATGNGYCMRIISPSDPVSQPEPQPQATPKRKKRSSARARRTRADRRAQRLADTFAEVQVDDTPRPPVARRPAPSSAPTWRPEENDTPPAPFLAGLRNTASAYASSVSTNLSAYDELPGRRLASIRDLIASAPDDSYPESAEESGFGQENPGWDYTGLADREAFVSFQTAADYCLTCSDDSSDRDYGLSHGCFMVEVAAQNGVVESD